MTKLSRVLVLVLTLFTVLAVAVSAGAQEAPCTSKILIPIRADEIPGAYGSIWQSLLSISNHGDDAVAVSGIFGCRIPPCQVEPLAPDTTATPRIHDDYLTIGCEAVADVAVNLRVRDLSRQKETWGTTIPVVHEEDFFYGGTFGITDVTNGEGFRSLLRIYTFEEGVTTAATVNVYSVSPNTEENDHHVDTLLTSFDVTLQPEPLDPRHTPGFAQIPLWTMQSLQGHERLRLEISGAADVGLWAMVSVTANETQFVTILNPGRLHGLHR